MYVPVPPVPVPRAVIVVPAVTPVPEISCPTPITPPVTAVTVNVVLEIAPVKVAPAVMVAVWAVPEPVDRL